MNRSIFIIYRLAILLCFFWNLLIIICNSVNSFLGNSFSCSSFFRCDFCNCLNFNKGIPCLTISPTLIRIFLTSPSADAGISIAALSVSRIIIESSEPTVCPTSTQTSITSTSSTSPRSGIKGLDMDISSWEWSSVISFFVSVFISGSLLVSWFFIPSFEFSDISISTKTYLV